MEEIKKVWFIKDLSPERPTAKLEEWKCQPSDPHALSLTTIDGVDLGVNTKWFNGQKTEANDLGPFNFFVINQLIDLMGKRQPLSLGSDDLELLSCWAKGVGQKRLAEVLTLSELANNYLTDRLSLDELIERMDKLEIVWEFPWKDIRDVCLKISKREREPLIAIEILGARVCPVFSTVAAKALRELPTSINVGASNAFLEHASRQGYPPATLLCWQLAASKQGNPIAKYNLACLYLQGVVEVRNRDKSAYQLLREAAHQRHRKARFWLAQCYEKGWGTEINQRKAILWYGKAAKDGYKKAEQAVRRLKHKTLEGREGI